MSKLRIFVVMVASVALSSVAVADGYEYEPVGKGFAPPPGLIYSGVVEGAAGWAWACNDRPSADLPCRADLDDEEFPLITGSGRVSVPLSLNMSIQFDIDGLATFTQRSENGGGEDNLHDYFFAGAHLAWRNPDQYALSVFGLGGSVNGGTDENALVGLVGGEGQWYWKNLTLYGQAGYFWANDENNENVMTEAWFVRGVMRYFFSPNQRLQGELSYAEGEEAEQFRPAFPRDEIEALSWEVRYDHTFHSKPIGWFATYHGLYMEERTLPRFPSADDDLTEHTFLLGVRFQFGAATMLENDRRGVTFDMPDVGRWTGYTLTVVD